MKRGDNKNIEEKQKEYVIKPVERVIHESMMPYSEFVIMDRALPRVEDGLKPVQRRVLFSMLEVGVLPDRPYRKSARIVGDCMGKYHPHGDRSIYDTMVRLAQPFNMSEMLVDGHGNFGSVDGDNAAAMRYTEARLSPISLELLKDIEKNTVKWRWNFDDSRKEPDMLPGRFPNLLVNGCTGIAVGLATNIPTHNLGEVIDGVVAFIDNKDITLSEMMQFIPAPDFPTGGYLLSSSEFNKVYETGKGRLILRARINIEKDENGKKNIVITEIPYNVNKSVLLQKIAKVKQDDATGFLSTIYEIVDESDRMGTRAVIKLKKDANVDAILSILYAKTDLQTTFNANMVAIADGRPKLLNLMDIISYYVNYQQQVVYRRTKYDLESCLKKEHILDGLYIAICNIDEVIKIIKTSKTVSIAKTSLMERFSLSDVQAQAILDMRLARLTSLEIDKLVGELKNLKRLIREYTQILKNPQMQMDIVRKEILEIKERYLTPRRTQIVDDGQGITEITNFVLDKQEELYIIFTPEETVKSVPKKSYNLATREINENSVVTDIAERVLKSQGQEVLLVFTNAGNMYKLNVSSISQCRYKDKGCKLTSLIKNMVSTEKVVAVYKEEEITSAEKVVMVTRQGMLKVSAGKDYSIVKSSAQAIRLKDDDQLIYVHPKADGRLVLISSAGNGVRVEFDDVTTSGRVSIGVKAIALDKLDYVVGVEAGDAKMPILLVSSNGFVKKIPASEVVESARNRKGNKVFSSKIVFAQNSDCVVTYKSVLRSIMMADVPLTNKSNAGKSVTGNKAGVQINDVCTITLSD